jgi:transposase
MDQDADFKPTHRHVKRLGKLLSPQARTARLAEARRREEALHTVKRAMDERGLLERAAIAKELPDVHRSSYRRWQKRYEEHGFEGLIDWRMPVENETMPAEVRQEICAMRRVDSQMPVEKIVSHVQQHFSFQTSVTTVKRVLHDAGLSRRPGPPPGTPGLGERRLELGGMKLVEAALQETGYLKSLTTGIQEHCEGVELPEPSPEVDRSDRDELGRFESSYNERYRKEPEDDLGPGFVTVEQKRQDKDPSQMHLWGASEEVLERKLKALLVSPLLGSGRWDGIRVPRGELLEELCGFAYMPSTLDLFTRELKYLGVSPTLWEIHARRWHGLTTGWGDPRRAAVLYVDESSKPVWTDLFSESTRVSAVGRVMPGLEQIAFHTGYGVPLWYVTHSGRTPLVTVVPELLDALTQWLEGSEVGRIMVIDAEANSVPFLRGLEQAPHPRAWVTRLRKSWLKGKRIFNRSNYRAYREGDRVRMGEADFNDPDGGTFRMRVVELERRTKGEVTYLGASTLLDPSEWPAAEVADLYFDRWPNQEANFRAVNRAVGQKDVHGYGKQLVDNVTVVRELDKLQARGRLLGEQRDTLTKEIGARGLTVREEQKRLDSVERRMETACGHVERILLNDPVNGLAELTSRSDKFRVLQQEAELIRKSLSKREPALEKLQQKFDKLEATLAKDEATIEELESRRRIFRHDVELDSLFALLKVGLVLMVTYVLKEYLGDARMEPVTFLERLATLPARLLMTPTHEILTFEYNRRDPDVMEYLRRCSDTINAREIRMESGRRLRVQVDPAPKPLRPPPVNRRTMPGDRFVKN